MWELHTLMRVITYIALSTVDLLLFIVVLYKSCIVNNIEKKRKIILSIALLIFSSQAFGFILEFIRLSLFEDQRLINTISFSLFVIATFLVIVSIILLYMFMGIQLFIVFGDTTYQIGKGIIYIHLIIFTLIVIMVINHIYAQITQKHVIVSTASIILLIAIGISHFVWTFNRKLYLMIVSYKQHSSGKLVVDAHHEMPMLRVIVKVSVLLTLMAINTISIIVIALLLTFIGGDVSIIVYWIIWLIYASSASLSIFLMLSISDKWYGCLCRSCHIRFQQICENCVSNSVHIKQGSTKQLSVVDNTSNPSSVHQTV